MTQTPNALTFLAGFLMLACAEGISTELTKKKYKSGYPNTKGLHRSRARAVRRAQKLLGYNGAMDDQGIALDARPCPYWADAGNVGGYTQMKWQQLDQEADLEGVWDDLPEEAGDKLTEMDEVLNNALKE
jgi:hypothetical protein